MTWYQIIENLSEKNITIKIRFSFIYRLHWCRARCHSNIDSTYEDGTFKIFRKYEATNNTSSSVLKKDNDDRKKTSKGEFKDRNEVKPY